MYSESKSKAIFLDRDGVINIERGEYTFQPEDFVYTDGLFSALKKFSESGYLLIVISNQSGIAKGLYTKQDVELLHQKFLNDCEKHKVLITAFYFCPHHPDFGKCLCRKPDSLLLEKSISRFNIDASQSWFVGDKERDKIAAEKAGIRSLLIRSNDSLLNQCSIILQ